MKSHKWDLGFPKKQEAKILTLGSKIGSTSCYFRLILLLFLLYNIIGFIQNKNKILKYFFTC